MASGINFNPIAVLAKMLGYLFDKIPISEGNKNVNY